MDELKENTLYYITKIATKTYGKNKKYILDLRDEKNNDFLHFVSNNFFEDLINELEVDDIRILIGKPWEK